MTEQSTQLAEGRIYDLYVVGTLLKEGENYEVQKEIKPVNALFFGRKALCGYQLMEGYLNFIYRDNRDQNIIHINCFPDNSLINDGTNVVQIERYTSFSDIKISGLPDAMLKRLHSLERFPIFLPIVGYAVKNEGDGYYRKRFQNLDNMLKEVGL